MATFTRTIFRNSNVTLLDFYDIIEKAKKLHKLDNAHAVELGKTLAFAEYLCTFYKSEKDTLSVTVMIDDSKIVVVGKGNHNLKGYIDEMDFTKELKGAIVVIKGENLKKPYTGTCFFEMALEDGFVNYFQQSEQNELHVDIKIDIENKYAKAIFSQFLPGATNEDMLAKDKLFIELDNQGLYDYFINNNEVLSTENFYYQCDCSQDRIERAIMALGLAEAREIVKEQGKIEVKCEFCQKTYTYFAEDIEKLFKGTND